MVWQEIGIENEKIFAIISVEKLILKNEKRVDT
jgi:hypothetical protein